MINIEWLEKPVWLLDISDQITSLLAFQLGSRQWQPWQKIWRPQNCLKRFISVFTLLWLDWIEWSALGPLAVSALPSLMLYSKCSQNHCWSRLNLPNLLKEKENTIPSMILIWNLTDLDEFKIRQTRPPTSQKALFKCNLFTSKETPISYIAHFLWSFSHNSSFWKLMFHNIRRKYSFTFSSTPWES